MVSLVWQSADFDLALERRRYTIELRRSDILSQKETRFDNARADC